MKRVLSVLGTVAAVLLAAALLAPWPGTSRPGPSPAPPATRDSGPAPVPPSPPRKDAVEVVRRAIPASAPAPSGAPAEPAGRLVLRGEVSVGGDSKPFPILRVRAVDAESSETVLEGDSSESGSYVLSGDIPLARVPFEVIVEAEGEGLIPAIWSRAGVSIETLPLERQVFPIVLHRPIEVRGRVLELPWDLPIAAARVSQAWEEERIRFGLRARFLRGIPRIPRATTDAMGEFRALVPAALRKGQLLVEADGFMPGSASWESGPPGDPVQIRLARVDQVPRIRGVVSGADGRPAAAVRVKAQVVGSRETPRGPLADALVRYSEFLQVAQPDLPTSTTDGAGGFLLPLPWLGRWKLYARLGEAGLAEAEVEVREAREYPCEVRSSADAVAIVGTVRGRRSRQPIEGASVGASLLAFPGVKDPHFQGTTLRTDEEGAFRFGPVPRKPYKLWIRAQGFAPASVQVSPDPDGPEQRIAAEMDEECRLRGTAVDEEGRPVAGARVLGGGEAGQAAEDGRFEIDGLPAGVDIRLSATATLPQEGGAPAIQLEAVPLSPIRFATPGEERDLGRVVLRRK